MAIILNTTMPQANFFFAYILWRDQDEENPLQTHVVFGFGRKSLEITRAVIQQGAQPRELLYLGPVCPLDTHHRRTINDLLDDASAVAEAQVTGG